jgi:hypothetical protein
MSQTAAIKKAPLIRGFVDLFIMPVRKLPDIASGGLSLSQPHRFLAGFTPDTVQITVKSRAIVAQ